MAEQDQKKAAGQQVADKPEVPEVADAADRTVIRSQEEIEEDLTPSRQQPPVPYVIVVDGPKTGTRFPLKEGANIVGRAPTNEIRLEDQSVSRQHAEINRSPSGWSVKDLGSKNGTSVNGKQISETVMIGHKDVVKTGIYQLRLITQKTPLEEELTLPPELASSDRTVFVAIPPDGLTSRMESSEVPEGKGEEEGQEQEAAGEPPPPEEEAPAAGPAPEGGKPSALEQIKSVIAVIVAAAKRDKRRAAIFGLAILVGIVSIGYLGKRVIFKPSEAPTVEPRAVPAKPAPKPTPAPAPAPEAAPTPEAAPEPPTPPEGAPPVPPEPSAAQPATPPPPPPAAPEAAARPATRELPVFIDFASSPMPAKVTFRGDELGSTPLRINVQLEPEVQNEAEATFFMKEINETYTQKLNFKVELGQSVVPVLFRAPIGIFKVVNLPRDVELYVEGKYVYDKYKSGTAKPDEIVLNKPIYMPYGDYVVELRRSRRMGETSSTYVSDIIYRREFKLAEDEPTYTLDVNDEGLKGFPVKVRSDPANAEVFIDGKLAGKTPYEGLFPLGEHRLVLRKEGYFEHAEDLKVDINTPFIADVKLQTSVAGAHLNNATLAMNRRMWKEAINELAQALTSDPAPTEIAQANYLLGKSYFEMGDIQRAIGYYEQARQVAETRNRAMLGLVACYAAQQQTARALPLLVEVLLKAKDEDVKREANDLFQKISPFKSVIYVYSEPAGAQVVVNDKPVAQPTPVILHDLPLGNYRLRVEKAGYLPTDLSLTLSVNEFNPVVVRLKPIPQ